MEAYSKERILRIREIDWEEEWSQFRRRLEDFAEEAGGGWVVKVNVGKGNARKVEGSSERPQAVFTKIAGVVEQEWTDGSDVSIVTVQQRKGKRGRLFTGRVGTRE